MESTLERNITIKQPNLSNLRGRKSERIFDSSSMRFYFRFSVYGASVTASFSFIEMSQPMLRINTARKLRALRNGIRVR